MRVIFDIEQCRLTLVILSIRLLPLLQDPFRISDMPFLLEFVVNVLIATQTQLGLS